MTVRGCAVIALAVVSALYAAVPADGATLPGRRKSCGETVERSMRLQNNLECPTGTALTITGRNLTLDLRGHRIAGGLAPDSRGLLLGPTADNVTIIGGVITGFDVGLEAIGLSTDKLRDLTVRNMVFAANPGDHIRVLQSVGAVISKNIFTRGRGVFLNGSVGNQLVGNVVVEGDVVLVDARTSRVQRNEIYGYTGLGLSITGGRDNVIVRNKVIANGSGIVTDETSRPVIENNVVRGNDGNGILVDESPDARVRGNRVQGNNFSGIELSGASTGARVIENVASANNSAGIAILEPATGAVVRRNAASENGTDGIFGEVGTAPLIVDNLTDYNGFFNGLNNDNGLGVRAGDAAPGSGGNGAGANDEFDPGTQCFPNSICTVRSPAYTVNIVGCNATVAPGFFRLGNPLDCANVALNVVGDGRQVDVRFHRVSGGTDPTDYAIWVVGAPNATVRNGIFVHSTKAVVVANSNGVYVFDSIAAFSSTQGVHVTDSVGMHCDGCTSVANTAEGVRASASSTSFNVENSDLLGNGGAGAMLLGSSDSFVVNSRVIGGSNAGVFAGSTTTELAMIGNDLVANAFQGAVMVQSDSGTIEDNRARGNDGNGLQVEALVGDAIGNDFRRNRSDGNGGDGLALLGQSDSGDIKRNVLSANSGMGLSMQPTSTGNEARRNRFNENGTHGAQLSNTANVTAFAANVANGNGFLNDSSPDGNDLGLGISAPPGTPGCGNTGARNDDPDQIEPASLKTPC